MKHSEEYLNSFSVEHLKKFDEDYYNGKPSIPDSTYDEIRAVVKSKNPDHPYFSKVGAPPSAHLSQVELVIHMGSQQKVDTEDDIRRWYESSVGSGELLVMEKLDGSSVEIVYDNGVLQRVATRGDGTIGNDITANARKWKNIPLSIPRYDKFVVRGEAILSISTWKDKFPGTSNPRNTSNGTIMRKDGEKNEHVSVIVFDCDTDGEHGDLLPDRLDARLLLLHDLGFDVVPCMVASNIGDLRNIYNTYRDTTRKSLDYEIDGLILSCPKKSTIRELGYKDGGSRPRGQAAYKFPPEKGVSKVVNITLTMGHTGALIPTAEVEPVRIGGVTITSILLNNQEFVRDLNVNIGDTVMIERAGDVIPYMSKVVEKNSEGCFKYPSSCPYCDGPLSLEGRHIICFNEECEGKSYQIIKNWVNKLDIKHLGDTLLRVLYDLEMVKEIPDLYDLTVDSIKSIRVGNGVLGKSMAEKVISEIDKTREIPVDLLMGSVSVKFLGRSMAGHIGLAHPNDYFSVGLEELSSKENMGVNKASMMMDSLKNRRETIEKILTKVSILAPKQVEKLSSKFSGVALVFTGVRPTAEEKELFESNGGIIKDSVSKNATHLVQKSAESESSKSKKARDLGLQVIGYKDFQMMLS